MAVAQIAEGAGVLAVLAALAYARHRQRRRQLVWTASHTSDDGPALVSLYGGPCAGTTVTVAGLPELHAQVDDGVTAATHRGCYRVDAIATQRRLVTATWTPAG